MSKEGLTAEELSADLAELASKAAECMFDPCAVHLTRTILLIENETLVKVYDMICLDCLGGKLKLGSMDLLVPGSGEPCDRCSGTGRVRRVCDDSDS